MSNNPFDDDYRSSAITKSNNLKSYTNSNNIEDEADFYEREIEKCMQESLDSTERSRRHLENSERIGSQTAQDLLEQREKLEKTEANLDQIHHTTQVTQRNLNSLKSVFGGYFKNKFSKKPVEPTASVPPSKSASHLSNTMGGLSGSAGGSGSSASFSGPSGAAAASLGGVRTLNDSSRNAIKGTRWEAMDNQIDENLDSMAANLRNLKGLGEAMGKEVEDQNEMLDRIHKKADRNDVIVRSQDKQMQKLLGAADATEESNNSSVVPSMDASTKMSFLMKATSMFR